MSLSSTYNTINSAFAANAAQSATIARNITNASTPGYSREIANIVDNPYGGADVASITRVANAALLDQVNTSTSESAAQTAISTGLATLAQSVSDSASSSTASGGDAERNLAVGDACQLAERAHDLRGRSGGSDGRSGRRDGRGRSRDVTQQWSGGGSTGALAGRCRHRGFRRDHQLAAQSVHPGQRDSCRRPANRRGRLVRAGHRRLYPDTAFTAGRHHHDHQLERLDIDLYR